MYFAICFHPYVGHLLTHKAVLCVEMGGLDALLASARADTRCPGPRRRRTNGSGEVLRPRCVWYACFG
ncbi:hypothetical protein FKP32DRAFT_303 [Trametes sanguinea]|nr:hypothetical protein FKP32DRAFT_303 [Trametes sanguinea]